MSRIPTRTVDQIYAAIDIVDVVSDYVQLKKKGANHWGLSPFQTEKTPSFAVNPVKGIYKDFSSGKGGNAVNFLMEMEGYSYVEALKHLARKYGIEIEEEEETPEQKVQRDKRESLFIVNEWAARWFHEQLLQTDEGKRIGLSYFKERGILQSTIDEFQLGYSPAAWEALAHAAGKAQHQEEYLKELGLVSHSEKTGKVYDRFRERVMFPIHNPVGKVVGFGGRILGNRKDVGKYINSSESEVYHKSQILYALHLAKKAMRDQNLCILTEGYMDVILLHQNGIKHVVASSGTALTVEQVRLIKRFTPNVLMIYDGDAAGVKAANRGIDLLLKAEMSAKVLILPDNHDPDSFVRQEGAQGFLDYANKEALSFLDFKMRVLTEGKDQSDPQVQAELIKGLAETVALVPDLVQRQMYVRHVAQKVEITEALMTHAVEEALKETNKQAIKEQRREQANKRSGKGSFKSREKGYHFRGVSDLGYQIESLKWRYWPDHADNPTLGELLAGLNEANFESEEKDSIKGIIRKKLDGLNNRLTESQFLFSQDEMKVVRQFLLTKGNPTARLLISLLILESVRSVSIVKDFSHTLMSPKGFLQLKREIGHLSEAQDLAVATIREIKPFPSREELEESQESDESSSPFESSEGESR